MQLGLTPHMMYCITAKLEYHNDITVTLVEHHNGVENRAFQVAAPLLVDAYPFRQQLHTAAQTPDQFVAWQTQPRLV